MNLVECFQKYIIFSDNFYSSVHLDGSYRELGTNSTFPNPNVVKFDLNSELIWVGTNSVSFIYTF